MYKENYKGFKTRHLERIQLEAFWIKGEIKRYNRRLTEIESEIDEVFCPNPVIYLNKKEYNKKAQELIRKEKNDRETS